MTSPEEPTPSRFFNMLHKVEDLFLASLLTALILISTLQIIQRNFLGTGSAWADEFTRILVLWIAMAGASVASRKANQITIDLISRYLRPKLKAAAFFITSLFTVAVCMVAAYYCFLFTEGEREYGSVIMGDFPAWVAQIVLPAGFALIAVRYLVHCVRAGKELLLDNKGGHSEGRS